jgi:hypothetical protein
MWNDSLPYQNGIYIYTSGKLNETTIFLGRDVIDPKIYEAAADLWKKIGLLVDEFRVKIKPLDRHLRGWILKLRPQNFQEGGKDKTNYFTHKDRAMCESNVLGYAQL